MINNPVLRKELLLRYRVRQSKAILIGIGGAIALIVGWLHWLVFRWITTDPSASSASAAWGVIMALQFLLVCLVAPSITANLITQEKEQQSWDMLVTTLLTPREIIYGKLLARLASLAVILLLFLPMTAFCALMSNLRAAGSLDHVTIVQFFGAYLLIGVTATFFATFGMYASWKLKRTLYAIMASYTFIVGILTLGTLLATSALSVFIHDSHLFDTCPLLWVNPGYLFAVTVSLNNPGPYMQPGFLVVGLLSYAFLTVLMLWRMVAGFQHYVRE